MCSEVLHELLAKRRQTDLAVKFIRVTGHVTHEVAQQILLVHLDLAHHSQGHRQLAIVLKR